MCSLQFTFAHVSCSTAGVSSTNLSTRAGVPARRPVADDPHQDVSSASVHRQGPPAVPLGGHRSILTRRGTHLTGASAQASCTDHRGVDCQAGVLQLILAFVFAYYWHLKRSK